nr:MAG TPA: hypothetical protein [Caudoviricetes sp.]
MFKKLFSRFHKKDVEDMPRPMGFVATINGFKDAELFEPRVEILVIPEDQQEVLGSITNSETNVRIELLDNNIIYYNPPIASNILMTPFSDLSELNDILVPMREQGIRGVLGWDMPI